MKKLIEESDIDENDSSDGEEEEEEASVIMIDDNNQLDNVENQDEFEQMIDQS